MREPYKAAMLVGRRGGGWGGRGGGRGRKGVGGEFEGGLRGGVEGE